MGKGKKQTIGYHYLFSLFWGLCRGPVNELVEIKAGDKTAWLGNACSDDIQYINKPNLFGGEKKEGGIQGPFLLFQGGADQVLPGDITAPKTIVGTDTPDGFGGILKVLFGGGLIASRLLPGIKRTIGPKMSEMRGVVTLWFDGLICSMNPYPKEWKFRFRRYNAGWFNDAPWYPEKAAIYLNSGRIHAMNPAHIIMECATNPEWGRGLSMSLIDTNSFVLAANKLCDEGFGLCLAWYRKEDIDAFISNVIDHIGGALYTDRETGLLTLKLIRDDYDVNDIPLFTPDSGLLEIVEDDSASSETSYSEIITTGHDPITDEEIQGRAHNIAAYQAQGSPSSLDSSYPGLPTHDLLNRVAARDLRALIGGLKKFDVRLDRRAWRITPGSVIRISDPRRNIANVVLRVGEIDDGNLIDGEIKLKAVQDVFGLPATTYITPVESSWTPPPTYPLPAVGKAFELSYRDLFRNADPGTTVEDDESFLGVYAAAPHNTMVLYNLTRKYEGELSYRNDGTHGFTGNLIVTNALGPLDTTIVIGESQELPDEDEQVSLVGTGLLIDDEIVRVDALDYATMTMTIARGCADTIPAAHPANSRAWFTDDDVGSDENSYVIGETVLAKVLPKTSQEVLLESQATALSVTMRGRASKPYPPADVRVFRPHRWWRLLVSKNAGDHPSYTTTALSQFRLYGVDGAEISGTLYVDSFQWGYGVENINAGTTEQWASQTGLALPHWVACDLGAGNEAAVARMLIVGREDAFSDSQTPDDFKLQWSDDSTDGATGTWTDWDEWSDMYRAPYWSDTYDLDARGDSSIFLPQPGIFAEPIIQWVERNRLTQQDVLVGHTAPSILGEVGQTYRITVFTGAGVQIGLYTGITDLFFQYTIARQAADGAGSTVRLVLQSERDGLLSTPYDSQIVVPIATGYGLGYGLNYGGPDL